MFTHKDIEQRTIFVINCLKERFLRVSSGELLLEELQGDKKLTLTKLPFQKILALFVIGHISVTTPLIEKCHKFGVALVVLKPNLRPVFFYSDSSEANFLLRQKQYLFPKNDLSIARFIVCNKIQNQRIILSKTRRKDDLTMQAMRQCESAILEIPLLNDYNKLMGIEGRISKVFFEVYFQQMNWCGRKPRIKSDPLNTTLDIGYTILFNFIECFLRLYGFDLYVGVYHRLWFKRKSLVCDLVEPFRCLIDHAVLLGYNRKQLSAKDFVCDRGVYRLKPDLTSHYYRVFYDALVERKVDIFRYTQSYYRYFMQRKSVSEFPNFQM